MPYYIVEFPIVIMIFELLFNLSVIINSSYIFTVQNSTRELNK